MPETWEDVVQRPFDVGTVVRLTRDRTSERLADVPEGTVGIVESVTSHNVMFVRVVTDKDPKDLVSAFPGEVEPA